QAKYAVVAGRHRGVGRHVLQPFGGAMRAESLVETDQAMARQILNPFRPAVTLDIGLTGINGPEGVRDLTPHELIVGVAGSQRDVGVSPGEIEIAIAGDEFDAQIRMARVEPLD